MDKLLTYLILLLITQVGITQTRISYLALDEGSKKYLFERSKMFEENADYQIFKIDGQVFNEAFFDLSFDNNISFVRFKTQKRIKRDNGLVSWFGNTVNPTRFCQFVINQKLETVRGLFFIGEKQYLIYPLSNGNHVLISSAMYKQNKCGDAITQLQSESAITENLNQYARALHCAQRVLFAFTPKAKIAEPDVKGHVQSEIDIVNMAYSFGGVNNALEVALIYETNYSESYDEEICWNDGLPYTKTTDLCRFQDNDDGHMDEVHGLRTMYHADMCVLLVDDLIDGVGGQAYDVGAGEEDEAFCVAIITNFASTVGHELGHLQGCHHDRYVLDGVLTPYHYGYVNITHSAPFRTIMAYDDEYDDNNIDCPLGTIYSTPNFNWNNVPAGDVHNPPFDSGHNNSQRIMDTKSLVQGFRTISNNLDVYTLFEFGDQEYVYATALNNIENKFALQAFPYKVGNGTVVYWRTENNMNLLPGFHAKTGSTFEAKISTTCTQPPF
jgi:hypothetical protein